VNAGNKWTIEVNAWKFASLLNSTLQLAIRLTSSDGGVFLVGQQDMENQVVMTFGTEDTHTTVGLLTVALIDGTLQPVDIAWSDNTELLTLSFPAFNYSMQYDPSFSILLSSGDGSSCNGNGDLLAIVLPTVLVGTLLFIVLLVVIVGTIVLGLLKYRVNWKRDKRMKAMELTLRE